MTHDVDARRMRPVLLLVWGGYITIHYTVIELQGMFLLLIPARTLCRMYRVSEEFESRDPEGTDPIT